MFLVLHACRVAYDASCLCASPLKIVVYVLTCARACVCMRVAVCVYSCVCMHGVRIILGASVIRLDRFGKFMLILIAFDL